MCYSFAKYLATLRLSKHKHHQIALTLFHIKNHQSVRKIFRMLEIFSTKCHVLFCHFFFGVRKNFIPIFISRPVEHCIVCTFIKRIKFRTTFSNNIPYIWNMMFSVFFGISYLRSHRLSGIKCSVPRGKLLIIFNTNHSNELIAKKMNILRKGICQWSYIIRYYPSKHKRNLLFTHKKRQEH